MKIRVILGALAFLVVFEFATLAFLATPRTTYAITPLPVTDVPVLTELRAEAIEKDIKLRWQTVAKMAFFQALLNAVTYFLQKIAYDTAIWASTGFQGQNPFAYGDNWYDYIGKEGLEAVGEFVGSLSQGLNIPGLNLCDPNLSLILKIQLGLRAQYSRPTPKCSWNQIQSAYSAAGLRQRGTDALRNSGLQFEPGQAPLSVALQLNRQVFTEELKATNAAINERLDQGPFRAVTDSITGRIKTPSAVVQNRFDASLQKGDDLNNLSITGAYVNSDVGIALAQTVISTFANTLATQLLDKVMGGFFPLSDLSGGDPLDFELAQPPGSRREQARQLFASLQTAPIRTIERFDLLGEFTSCPDNPAPMNCVIDEAFATAVRQAAAGNPLTVRDAMQQSPPLIRGDWPLWPPSALDKNQDPDCYRTGFCYANLVKLRRARIIPVGWELAAMRSEPGNPVTLAEVIAGYDNCTEDGTVGDDETTRWCHLIDPNWVLKYPLTQCRQLGPGATLLDPSGDRRGEVCVDMPSCNATDNNGNCIGGWGYCTRERNLWRFDGDDCPAHAASCQVMQTAAGVRLALLTNTADFGVCSADNAGCRWYSTLPDPTDPLGWDTNSRMYLNGRASECDASSAGCTELVPKRGGVTFNLVRNSSFEADNRDPAGRPDFWNGIPTEYGDDNNFTGARAVRLSGATRLSERITVRPNQFYTMSFHAKRATATGRARVAASLRNTTGGTGGLALGNYFVSSTCARELPNVISTEQDLAADYSRYSCTFTTPAGAAYLYLELSADAGGVWFDGVQLEENEFASSYGEGYNGPGAADRSWLKLPPQNLCTGSDDDPELCDDYAQVCAATEVGCEQYSPLSGEPPVTGIARALDACPLACVGYETFREEPTSFNPDGDYPLYFIPQTAQRCSVSNAGCDEFTNLDAGPGAEAREYYTFLRLCEEPSPGDDTATYYTWEGTEAEGFQLRVWQLKSSNLTADAPDISTDPTGGVAPCTAYNAQNSTCRDGDGLEDDDALPGDTEFEPPVLCNDAVDIFTNPDCREFYDTDGNIHYRLFSRTILKTTECTDYRKTLALGLDPQASCNDSGGRFQAGTLECFYRANVPTSTSCPASENQCRLYTGNAGRNVELLFEDDFEDGDTVGWTGGVISAESLAATGQSMRKADGAIALRTEAMGGPDELEGRTLFLSFWARGTARRILEIRFENAPAGASTSARRYFSYSDTDIATPTALLTSDWRFFEFGPVTVDWNFATGEDLIIAAPAGTELFIDNIRLRAVSSVIAVIRDSWETDPVCDATSEGTYSAQEMLGCETYRDRAGNEVHLRSFSRLCSPEVVGCEAFFNTHNSTSPYAETWNFICVRQDRASGPCYVDPDGTGGGALPTQVCVVPTGRDRCEFRYDNELVGVTPSPYTPATGAPVFLPYITDTVSATDPDGAAGPLIATFPFFVGPDVAVVPADSTVYVVDDPGKRCQPDAVGCQAVGLPTFDQELALVTEFESVHRLNLPDRYNEFLCTNEALFCEAWRDSENTEWYFKNPQDKTCEWRETGPGGTRGWFQSGSNEPCYGNFVVTGTEYGIWNNRAVCAITDSADAGTATTCTVAGGCRCPGNDANAGVGDVVQCTVVRGERTCSPYGGWVGTCEEQHNACTEFLDPQDTDQNELTGAPRWPTGRPHYVIDNDRLDESLRVPTERCEGQVSLNEGCVLFNDTSDSARYWSAGATYSKSEKEANFGRVAPVNCVNPSPADAPYCRRCFSAAGNPPGDYCTEDADCPAFRTCTYGYFINDSNRILKVRRDRECAEWLACDQPDEVWDPRVSEWKTVCSSLDVCDEAISGGLGECRYVIDKPEPQVLSADTYARRDISWYGKDYSGYSIPNQYSVDTLEPVNVGACVPDDFTEPNLTIPGPLVSSYGCRTEGDVSDCDAGEKCAPHFRLGRALGPCGVAPAGAECLVGRCSNGAVCATDADCTSGSCSFADPEFGYCYNRLCVDPPNGENIGLISSESAPPPLCRIYPETNAPFPNIVVDADAPDAGWNDVSGEAFLDTPQSVIHGFQNAQLCARGENCECSYQRVSFEGGESRYYSQGNSGPALGGICTSGESIGIACGVDANCSEAGDCSKRSKSDRFIGLPGFCLEPDRSQNINGQQGEYACLTWYPVDRIAGAADLYNQFISASFQSTVGNEWYCAEGEEPLGYSPRELPPDGLRGPILFFSYDQDSARINRVFGEPEAQECTGPDDYDCIVGGFETGGAEDCEADSEAWCIWPQRSCTIQNGFSGSAGSNAWCEQRNDGSGPNNNREDSDGSLGINFFGCYEVADHATFGTGEVRFPTSEIRYPWLGPAIYRWQVEAFEMQFEQPWVSSRGLAGLGAAVGLVGGVPGAAAGAAFGETVEDFIGSPSSYDCAGYTGENAESDSEFAGDRVIFFPSDSDFLETGTAPRNMSQDSDADFNMHAIWDGDGRLRGFSVMADDEHDESVFFIYSLTIHFWPSCIAVAHAGDPDNAAAYTDRVVGGNYTIDPPADLGADEQCLRWGAICRFDESGETVVVNEPGTVASEDGTTDALYPSSSTLRELFARSNEGLRFDRVISGARVCSGGAFAGRPCASAEICQYSGTCSRVCIDDIGNPTTMVCTDDADCPDEHTCLAPDSPVYYCAGDFPAEGWACTIGLAGACDSPAGITCTESAAVYLGGDFRYEPSTLPADQWDDTESADGGASGAPQVRAVGLCDITGTCAELDIEGLTVNGGTDGTIRGTRQVRTQVRFFAFADHDRMPITRVVMDWGDQDQIVPQNGLFKNHRGKDVCGGEDAPFGLQDVACEAKPFTFVHDYRCSAAFRAALPDCFALDTSPGGRHVGAYQAGGGEGGCRRGNACVYVPRVMVVDNWGWCSGDCPDAPGAAGCYDGSQNTGTPTSTANECNTELPKADIGGTSLDESETDPWVYFRGEIVVEVED